MRATGEGGHDRLAPADDAARADRRAKRRGTVFIEELTKSVLENAGSYTLSPPSLTVPETLQALLTARLDRLPGGQARRTGRGNNRARIYSPLLAAVAQIPDKQLVDGLDELIGSGLASLRGGPTDAIYSFKHALVQEAIYESVLRRRRAEIHARIVEAAERMHRSA